MRSLCGESMDSVKGGAHCFNFPITILYGRPHGSPFTESRSSCQVSAFALPIRCRRLRLASSHALAAAPSSARETDPRRRPRRQCLSRSRAALATRRSPAISGLHQYIARRVRGTTLGIAKSQARVRRFPSLSAHPSGFPSISSTGQIPARRAPSNLSSSRARSDQRGGRGRRRLSTCSWVNPKSTSM